MKQRGKNNWSPIYTGVELPVKKIVILFLKVRFQAKYLNAIQTQPPIIAQTFSLKKKQNKILVRSSLFIEFSCFKNEKPSII